MDTDLDDRPSKRPTRENGESSSSLDATYANNAFIKVEELWIDDGNIVLMCGDHGFRVHEGVLALNSEMFRDMFKVATSSHSSNSSLHGCPVVHLGDDVNDVKHILKALYHRE